MPLCTGSFGLGVLAWYLALDPESLVGGYYYVRTHLVGKHYSEFPESMTNLLGTWLGFISSLVEQLNHVVKGKIMNPKMHYIPKEMNRTLQEDEASG